MDYKYVTDMPYYKKIGVVLKRMQVLRTLYIY